MYFCWWECKLVQLLWKTVWRFLKKLKIELPYVPAIPFLGIHSKEMKSVSRDFPGGPVVKNMRFNAGDVGLIPGQGTKIPHVAGQLSLRCNY